MLGETSSPFSTLDTTLSNYVCYVSQAPLYNTIKIKLLMLK